MPNEDLTVPERPTALWRAASVFTTAATGCVVRLFLFGGLCKYDIHGLNSFVDLLDSRQDINGRQRGLLTVSNHLSVVDDPLIWAPLPFKYAVSPDNLRWSLGSYDICFKTGLSSAFFTFGQLLPTHRLRHSQFGGLFQPTMTQAIRLLSAGPFPRAHSYIVTPDSPKPKNVFTKPDLPDPFTSGSFTYTTNGYDVFPSPSAYLSRRHAWVHVFPEGMIHQTAELNMRYFRWGVSRLILESEPCPDVVPMWIEGMEQVMSERRTFPRFIPRIWGKTISITYGAALDTDHLFGDLRDRWKELCSREYKRLGGELDREFGVLPDALKYNEEAIELRKECTLRVREEVLKLRRNRGWSDEDPKWSMVQTHIREGGKAEGRMPDGSIVKEG